MGRVILLAFAGFVVGGLVGAFPGWSFFSGITLKIPVYMGGSSFSSQEYDLSRIIVALGFVFGAIYLAALLVIGVPYLRYLLA